MNSVLKRTFFGSVLAVSLAGSVAHARGGTSEYEPLFEEMQIEEVLIESGVPPTSERPVTQP
jgi:hypothetical protein